MQQKLNQAPSTQRHSVRTYDFDKITYYLRHYPNRDKSSGYAWFINALKHGVNIHSMRSVPSRLKDNNASFSNSEKCSIAKQVIKWRLNQYVIGPLPIGMSRLVDTHIWVGG